MERIGFVPMVIWNVIEILRKTAGPRTVPGGNAAHREKGRLRKWRAAVRFRLKEEAGFWIIEKRIAGPPQGSFLLPLPKGLAKFF
jgi:hypothetical protein